MPSGILLLDKPLGLSSNAALQRVRSLFGRCKAGHVGSLDPLATGMLPIVLGEATKVAAEILASRKCYRFRIALGTQTASGDAEGEVIAMRPVPQLQSEAVTALLERMQGPQQQTPPMYSAIKHHGQPLYRLARAGIEVPREPRAVDLVHLRLTALEDSLLEVEVLCSKGTYVRVLAQDIATALGTVGHVSALRRLYVEPFAHDAMHTLESLRAEISAGREVALIRMDRALTHLPALEFDAEAVRRLCLGQIVLQAGAPSGRVRLYASGARFIGLGEVAPGGAVQPRRLVETTEH